MVNVFLCRHPVRSSLSFRLGSDPLVLLGIAVEVALLLAVVYTPPGAWLFGTAPLGVSAWLPAIPFALAMWSLDRDHLNTSASALPGRGVALPGRGREGYLVPGCDTIPAVARCAAANGRRPAAQGPRRAATGRARVGP